MREQQEHEGKTEKALPSVANQPQEPLLSRDATVRPSRPRVTDRAVAEAAALRMLPEISEWAGEELTDRQAEDARAMLSGMVYSDAYEMAREFERDGWDADSALVDVLEGWDMYLRSAHLAAVGDWLAAYNVRPRYGVGQSVAVPNKPGMVGVIARVDEREGTYTVRVESLGHVAEGLGTHGFIFAWEDVEGATDDAAGSVVLVVDPSWSTPTERDP